MIHDQGVTVGQIKVPAGTNEITQVETLLAGVPVDAAGSVMLTVDAAHTQRDTAEHVKGELGFDYLMTVKGNQPSLQQDVVNKCLPLLAAEPEHIVEERPRPYQPLVDLDHRCHRNRLPPHRAGGMYPP